MYTIRREESVLDALFQAIGIDWIPEICVSVPVVLPERSCRHADLKRRACSRRHAGDVTIDQRHKRKTDQRRRSGDGHHRAPGRRSGKRRKRHEPQRKRDAR